MGYEDFIKALKNISDSFDEIRIREACLFAEKYHEGQFRKSGEKYIVHPYEVALILARLKLDDDTIIAGILHDTLEDTSVSYSELEEKFGTDVAAIVDGVTKILKIKYESKTLQQSENFRKMLLAMSKDIRVILVKLADRLHNMRTLQYKNASSIKIKSEETLEIYAPIAHRLGIFSMKSELEDLAFSYLYPEEYKNLVEKVTKQKVEREKYIDRIILEIKDLLKNVCPKAKIYGRIKNYYSIYKKMTLKNKTFEEIHDITAIRIIVDELSQCYGVLGIIHSKWKPIPGRFKDYIAMPKPNKYQSLHTTLLSKDADAFEVQIRTFEMHQVAEYGIAAHWRYKQQKEERDKNLYWIEQMMEWQRELENPEEFISTVKMDLYSSQVYVFTPRGNVIELPEGSTPIDFAYKIHTDIGNHCVGAKVNSRIVPLNYVLKIGDIVEILTSKSSFGPSIDWLGFVRSSHAKNKIKNYLRKASKQENIVKGKDIIEKALSKIGLSTKDVFTDEVYSELSEKLSLKSLDHLYESLGYGGINTRQVLPVIRKHFIELDKDKRIFKKKKKKGLDTGIIVQGMDDMLIKYAKCCNPIPGDSIIGFITRGSGVTIHRSNCSNFSSEELNSKRFLPVEWNENTNQDYTANLKIIARDRKNILKEITDIFQNSGMDISSLNVKINNDRLLKLVISFYVKNVSEVIKVQHKIKSLNSVMEVNRF